MGGVPAAQPPDEPAGEERVVGTISAGRTQAGSMERGAGLGVESAVPTRDARFCPNPHPRGMPCQGYAARRFAPQFRPPGRAHVCDGQTIEKASKALATDPTYKPRAGASPGDRRSPEEPARCGSVEACGTETGKPYRPDRAPGCWVPLSEAACMRGASLRTAAHAGSPERRATRCPRT